MGDAVRQRTPLSARDTPTPNFLSGEVRIGYTATAPSCKKRHRRNGADGFFPDAAGLPACQERPQCPAVYHRRLDGRSDRDRFVYPISYSPMNDAACANNTLNSYHLSCRVYVAATKAQLSSRSYFLTPITVAKTRTQLNRRLADGQKLPWPPFGKQWYAGCTTLIIGNSLKAGIREEPRRLR